MHLHTYLEMLSRAEEHLARYFREVADAHAAVADVSFGCAMFARQADAHVAALGPILERYADRAEDPPERLHVATPGPPRTGAIGLLRDLAELHQLAALIETAWQLVSQAAQGARDRELIDASGVCSDETTAQLEWLTMRMKSDAAQTLLVAD